MMNKSQKNFLKIIGAGITIGKQIKQAQTIQVQEVVNKKAIDPNFFKNLEAIFDTIFKCSRFLKDHDSQVQMMKSIQWFRINEYQLSDQLSDPNNIKSSVKLMLDGFRKLLNTLENSLKDDVLSSYHISSICHIFLNFMFAYFVKNGSKYLDQDIQQSLNDDLSKVLTILESEKNASIQSQALAYDIEFELHMIQAGLTIIPNNPQEGVQLLTTFLGGALRSVLTMKFDDSLLTSIKDGVKFLVKQNQQSNSKKKFEAVYFIENFKWQLIFYLEKKKEAKSDSKIKEYAIQDIEDKIAEVQSSLRLSDNSLWEVHYAWIKMVSFIIDFKIPVEVKELKEFLDSEILKPKQEQARLSDKILDPSIRQSQKIPQNEVQKSQKLNKEISAEDLFKQLKDANWIIQAGENDTNVILNSQSSQRLLDKPEEEKIKNFFLSRYPHLEAIQNMLFFGNDRVFGIEMYKYYGKTNKSKFNSYAKQLTKKKSQGETIFQKKLKKLKPNDLNTNLDNYEYQLDKKQIEITEIQQNMRKWIRDILESLQKNNAQGLENTSKTIMENLILFSSDIFDISRDLEKLQDGLSSQIENCQEFLQLLLLINKDIKAEDQKQGPILTTGNSFSEIYQFFFSKEKLKRTVQTFEELLDSFLQDICNLKNTKGILEVTQTSQTYSTETIFSLTFIVQKFTLAVKKVNETKFDFYNLYCNNGEDREIFIDYRRKLFEFLKNIENILSSLVKSDYKIQQIIEITQLYKKNSEEADIQNSLERIAIEYIQQNNKGFDLNFFINWVGKIFPKPMLTSDQIDLISRTFDPDEPLKLELLHIVFQNYFIINPDFNLFVSYISQILEFFISQFRSLQDKLYSQNYSIQECASKIDELNNGYENRKHNFIEDKAKFKEIIFNIQKIYSTIFSQQHDEFSQLAIKQFDIFIKDWQLFYKQFFQNEKKSQFLELEKNLLKIVKSPLINFVNTISQNSIRIIIKETQAIATSTPKDKIFNEIDIDFHKHKECNETNIQYYLDYNHVIEVKNYKALKMVGEVRQMANQNVLIIEKIVASVNKLKNIMEFKKITQELEQQLKVQENKLTLYNNIISEQEKEMSIIKEGQINCKQVVDFFDSQDILLNQLLLKMNEALQKEGGERDEGEFDNIHEQLKRYRFLKDFLRNETMNEGMKLNLIQIHFEDFQEINQQQIRQLEAQQLKFTQLQVQYTNQSQKIQSNMEEINSVIKNLNDVIDATLNSYKEIQNHIEQQARNYEKYQKFIKDLSQTFQAIKFISSSNNVVQSAKNSSERYQRLIKDSYESFRQNLENSRDQDQQINLENIISQLNQIGYLLVQISYISQKQQFDDPQIQKIIMTLSSGPIGELQGEINDKLKEILKEKKSQIIQKLSDPIKSKFNNLLKNHKKLAKEVMTIKKDINMAKRVARKVNSYRKPNQKWRVRQCLVFSLISIISQSLNSQIVEKANQTLIFMRGLETNPKIQGFLTQTEIIASVNESLNHNWYTVQETVKKELEEKLEKLKDIQSEIQSELNEEKRVKLYQEHKQLQDKITYQITQVDNIGGQMGIVIHFVKDIKQDLMRLEGKINKIMKDIQEIGLDLKYLRGNTVQQMFEMQMQRVIREKDKIDMKNVYVNIEMQEIIGLNKSKSIQRSLDISQFQPKNDDEKDMAAVNQFLWVDKNKDVLLIHGQAGSGKSTVGRKIEEYIWENYQEQKYEWGQEQTNPRAVPLVVITVSLPNIHRPSEQILDQALKSDRYRFDDKQLLEFKESLEKGKIRMVLILDSYDEMKKQFVGQNLFHSNHLEKFIIRSEKTGEFLSKVIITCRTEAFAGKTDYASRYWNKQDSFREYTILNFDQSKIDQYLQMYCKKSIFLMFLSLYEQVGHCNDDILVQWYKNSRHKIEIVLNTSVITEDQIEEVLHTIKSQDKSISFTREQKLTIYKKIQERWTEYKFISVIKQMSLMNIIETPFMMEIVVKALPYLYKNYCQVEKIQIRFNRAFIQNLLRRLQSAILISSYQQKIIITKRLLKGVSHLQELFDTYDQTLSYESVVLESFDKIIKNEYYSTEDEEFYQQCAIFSIRICNFIWSKIENFCASQEGGLELILQENMLHNYADRVFNFSDLPTPIAISVFSSQDFKDIGSQIESEVFSLKSENIKFIQSILQTNQLKKYDFYEEFIDKFIDSSIQKWRNRGETLVNFDTIKYDLQEMGMSLAQDMTEQNLTSVNYEQKGQYFGKNRQKDNEIWDKYFDETTRQGKVLALLRSGIPLVKKGVKYSFIHKSVQEFLVAKRIYEDLLEYHKKFDQELVNAVKECMLSKKYDITNQFDFFECNDKTFHLQVRKILNTQKEETYQKRLKSFLNKMNIISSNTFNQINLLESAFTLGVVHFLKTRVELDIHFKHALFTVVTLTRITNKIIKAGSNAMSLLNYCSVDMMYQDFRFVRIQNTSVESINLFGSNLESSYFSNVNINGANLCFVNMRNARFEEVIVKQEKTPLIGHKGEVYAATYSPNGQLVVSGGQDGTIKIWDPSTSVMEKSIEVGTSVLCLCYNPNGNILACGVGKNIQIWDTTQWTMIAGPLEGHKEDIECIRFSLDGRYLLSGGDELICWNVETFTIIDRSNKHKKSVTSLSFSKDNKKLVTASKDKTIAFWDIKQGLKFIKSYLFKNCIQDEVPSGDKNKESPLKQQKKPSFDGIVRYSPDGVNIAVSCTDYRISIIELKSLNEIYKLKLPRAKFLITNFQYTSDGKQIVSSMTDCSVRIWRLSDQKQLFNVQGHNAKVNALSVFTQGKKIVSASSDGTLKIWDLETKKQIVKFSRGHKKPVFYVEFTPDGMQLVSVSQDLYLKLWNAYTGNLCGNAELNESQIVCNVFTRNGKQMYTLNQVGFLIVWDVQTQSRLTKREIKLEEKQVIKRADISQDGEYLCYFDFYKKSLVVLNRQLVIYKEIQIQQEEIEFIKFSPNSETILFSGENNNFYLWNFKSDEERINFIGHSGRVNDSNFSLNNQYIASASQDKTVKIWKISTQEQFGEDFVHEEVVKQVKISPNFELLATLTIEGNLRIWNLNEHQQLGNIQSTSVLSFAFSPDSNRLITGEQGGSLRLWESLVELLPGKYQDSFELSQYNPFVNSISVTAQKSTLKCSFVQTEGCVVEGNEVFQTQILTHSVDQNTKPVQTEKQLE